MKTKPIYEIRLPVGCNLSIEEHNRILDSIRKEMPDYHVMLFSNDVTTTVKKEPKWYQFWK